MIWRSIYILKQREGRILGTSHDGYIEGSQGVFNRNLRRVDLNEVPSLIGK